MVVLLLSRTSVKKANSEKSSTRWGGVAVVSTRPAVQRLTIISVLPSGVSLVSARTVSLVKTVLSSWC